MISWTEVRGIAKLVWVFRCDLGALDGVLPLSDISDNLSNPSIFWIFSWFWNWRICLVAELVLGKLNYFPGQLMIFSLCWVYLCDRGCMILFIPSCETPEKTDDASDWAPLGLLGLKNHLINHDTLIENLPLSCTTKSRSPPFINKIFDTICSLTQVDNRVAGVILWCSN